MTPRHDEKKPEHIKPVHVIGTGAYVPERILTNADFERMVDTSDEWIVTRTGIRERRIAAPGQATSDLCLAAARHALDMSHTAASELDFLIVGTFTPDRPLPSSACILQSKLGAKKAAAFDVAAACSGFMYSLDIARGLLASGRGQRALILGADTLSPYTDYTDRATCVLFGDAAGAAVLGVGIPDGHEILLTHIASDGDGADLMTIPAGGTATPTTHETLDSRRHYMKIKGREVFKFVVTTLEKLVRDAVAKCGLTVDDVALLIPHQMNLRIIESAVERLGFPLDKVVINIDRYGNTSAASIPLALDEVARNGRLKKGDVIVLASFGGGLTWASAVVKW